VAVIRSSGLEPVDVYSVDVRAPTFARVLRKVQGAASKLRAMITDDGDADHIIHDGQGRGARLGLAYAGCYLGSSLSSTDPTIGKNGGSSPNTTASFPFVVYVPPAEGGRALYVDVECLGFSPREALSTVHVTDLAGFTSTRTIRSEGEVKPNVYRTPFFNVPAGLHVVIVRMRQIPDGASSYRVGSVAIHVTGNATLREPPGVDDGLVPVTRVRVATPGASEAHRFREFDSTEVADDDALTGHHVGWIDQNLNALEEYATGFPAGGVAGYRLTEDQLEDPTRDRFAASTRKTFADEPRQHWPLLSHCFGGIRQAVSGPDDVFGLLVERAVPPTEGTPGYWAPFPSAGSKLTLGLLLVSIPDIEADVQCRVLLASSESVLPTASDFTAYVQLGANAEQSVTLTAAGATGFYYADFASVPYDRDAVQTFAVRLARTSGVFAIGEMVLVSACLWSEP
jgi:hypothetical protein